MVEHSSARTSRARQADILTAAEREFGALGWVGGRVERIAREARVNKQLLFHYYASKEGLFSAALRSLLDRFAPPEPAAGTVDEVRSLMRTVEAASRGIPGILLQPPAPAHGEHYPTGALLALRDWRERHRARLADALTEGQRRGHVRDDIDPVAAADVGLAMALGAGALGGATDAARWMVDYCAWR